MKLVEKLKVELDRINDYAGPRIMRGEEVDPKILKRCREISDKIDELIAPSYEPALSYGETGGL